VEQNLDFSIVIPKKPLFPKVRTQHFAISYPNPASAEIYRPVSQSLGESSNSLNWSVIPAIHTEHFFSSYIFVYIYTIIALNNGFSLLQIGLRTYQLANCKVWPRNLTYVYKNIHQYIDTYIANIYTRICAHNIPFSVHISVYTYDISTIAGLTQRFFTVDWITHAPHKLKGMAMCFYHTYTNSYVCKCMFVYIHTVLLTFSFVCLCYMNCKGTNIIKPF